MVVLEGLASLGFLSLCRFAARGGTTLMKQRSPIYLNGKGQEWAVITGASSGIGAEYARQLGAKGYNLLLISRTESKLDHLAVEIRSHNPAIDIQTIPIDFAKEPLKDQFRSISESLEAIHPVGILVNNVAMNYSYPQLFSTASIEEDEALIRVNISTTNRMTKLVLPKMLQQKRGVILNLGSLTSAMPTPMLSVYSGTKSYADQFTKSLNGEFLSSGIVCQCVAPGLTATKMSQSKEKFLVPSAEKLVALSLGNIYPGRIVPYFPHQVMDWLATVLPEDFIAAKLLSFNKEANDMAIKKELLRKRKRKKSQTPTTRKTQP